MNYDGRDPYQMNNDDICGAGDPDGGRGTIMRSDMDARVNDVVNDECYNHGSVSLPSTTSPDTYDVRDESHRETLIQVFSAWAQGFREMMEEAMCWEAQKSLSDDMHGLTALLNVETDKLEQLITQIERDRLQHREYTQKALFESHAALGSLIVPSREPEGLHAGGQTRKKET